MTYDNGGARAIRGMNYQAAVVTLVAIRNFTKPNFNIFVETEDDFVVEYDGYHAYIQVKGEGRIGLKKMIKNSDGKPSMFEKQFISGDKTSKYKFVVYTFTETDLKKMLNQKDELFENSYLLSDEQVKDVLKNSSIDDASKVDNFRLVCTPFKNNLSDAIKQIIGEMVTTGLVVDRRGESVVNELMRLIYQKSEIELQIDSDKQLKCLSSDELNSLLVKIESLEMFNRVLDKLNYNELKKAKIEKEKLKITTQYMSIKTKLLSELKKIDKLDEKSENEIINMFLDFPILHSLEQTEKIALIISAYCDVIGGVFYG